ncbi:MAG: ABC transporter permease [Lachnospiraceae bacterium]|nr:ABC transporter permease [Lachnospiraceae bacterium]
MNTKSYFYGQSKRIRKLFRGIFCLSIVFALVIGICGYLYSSNSNYTKKTSKYEIGLLCANESEIVSVGLNLAQNLDDSKYIINIKEFSSEEEGFDALHRNQISAFLVIPDEPIEELIAQHQPPHVKLYTASQKGITTVVMEEVASIISDDLIYTEAAMCAFHDALVETDYSEVRKELLAKELLLTYAGVLLTRSSISNVVVLGLENGLSLFGFFFCGLILFYTVMLSFCCISYFLGKRNEFFMLSAANGVKATKQVLCEFVCFYAANLICALFTLLCVYIVLRTGIMEVPELSGHLTQKYLTFTGMYLVILLGLCAFEFMLFDAIGGIINKFLMPFIVLIGCSFLSGYFYPASFLPKAAQSIGAVLPTGVSYRLLAATLTGQNIGLPLLLFLTYAIAELAIAIRVRKLRIEKGID